MKKSIVTYSILLVMVLIAGCKTATKASASKENLTSKAWVLSLIGDKRVVAADYSNGLPDLIFSSNNRVSGYAGCNRFGGIYTLDAEGKLSLSQLISTKMFCQGVPENEYMSALARANRAKIEGEDLVLYFENETVLVFTPKKLE